MVGTNNAADVSLRLAAESRTPMSAEIMERANFSLIVTENQDGIVTNIPGQIVSDRRYFAVVGHKQPTRPPNSLGFDRVDRAIEIEGLRQREARLAGRNERLDFPSVHSIYHEENSPKTTAKP